MSDTIQPGSGGPAREIFYQSVRSYRNARTGAMVLVCALIATFYGVLSSGYLGKGGAPSRASMYIAVLAAVFGAVGAKKMISNTREAIEISLDGVQFYARSWTWGEILKIKYARSGSAKKGLIALDVIRRALPARAELPGTVVLLGMTPMTPEEYQVFAARLRERLRTVYPHVEVVD